MDRDHPRRWVPAQMPGHGMLTRARRRLTLVYLALLAIVMAGFSGAFYLALATALQPVFDLAPEISSGQTASAAYGAALERVAISLIVANVLALFLVAIVAWILAGRSLRPLIEAQQRQRRFVADASHEIRNPISSIRAIAEGALATPSDASGLRAALERVVTEDERLGRLANDLLVLARAERTSEEMTIGPVDLSLVVAEAADAVRSARPTPPPRIDLALEPDLDVVGSASEIARIVTNLIDNAVTYGGSPVHVVTSGQTHQAHVVITDRGPGMAAVDLARVGEPFFRVHSEASTPAGTGLGVAIAMALARHNGGTVTLESQPGRGTRARLTLRRFI
jgi:signal transduction histidine kinase